MELDNTPVDWDQMHSGNLLEQVQMSLDWPFWPDPVGEYVEMAGEERMADGDDFENYE
jgi:hypothetical protein